MSICLIPKTLEELAQALDQLTEQSLILAGGTDLVLHMRARHLQPDVLLSLSDVAALRDIVITPERAVIGAMATMARVKEATDGLQDLQALADAAGGVGSPQIRNKGTIGGNVANASPAADLPCVLWLLDAQANLLCPGGRRRTVPMVEFFQGRDGRKTQLEPGEVILSFTVDRAALGGWRSAFHKLGHRSQVTISRIGMAIALRLNEAGVIEDARVVAGAIKPTPFRLPAAEDILRGRRPAPTPELCIALGETFKGNTRRVYKENAAKGVFEDTLKLFAR